MKRCLGVGGAVLCVTMAITAQAEIQVPSVIGSNMVLKRNSEAAVADEDTVSVSCAGIADACVVHYNRADNPTGDLVNSEDLPAGAFETKGAD